MKLSTQQCSAPILWKTVVCCAVASVSLSGLARSSGSYKDARRYTTTQIGDGRVACALNDLGQIAGMSGSSSGVDNQALALKQNDPLFPTTESVAGGGLICASGINNNGELAGSLNGEAAVVPFISTPGARVQRLPLLVGRNGG